MRRIFFFCMGHESEPVEVKEVLLADGETAAEYLDNHDRDPGNRRKAGEAVDLGYLPKMLARAFDAGRRWQARQDGRWEDEDK
ncbi:MAG: hypothetical protein ACM3NH_04345 [Candidatus Saccharibacteria bacterium]